MLGRIEESFDERARSEERLRRWRLLLGGHEADGIGFSLGGEDVTMDKAMQALYDPGLGQGAGRGRSRMAGLGGSYPNAARWLGDIREHFPTSVVRVMQKDAMERLDLRQLMLEPEMLERFPLTLDGADWVKRMQTPPEKVAMLRQLLREANPQVRAAFEVRDEDPWSFTIPIGLMRARKPR